MVRRAGITLIEVLVTIFVMGIGLMGLLTLFPVGAISMAQAILDDQAANAAFNAASIAESQSLRSSLSIQFAGPLPRERHPKLSPDRRTAAFARRQTM